MKYREDVTMKSEIGFEVLIVKEFAPSASFNIPTS